MGEIWVNEAIVMRLRQVQSGQSTCMVSTSAAGTQVEAVFSLLQSEVCEARLMCSEVGIEVGS